MSGLNSIPVKFITTEKNDSAESLALPVLHEIAAMLEALIASGATNSIDLRREPLKPKDYKELRDVLGVGEISARLDCLGSTHIKETAISGIWWITHYDEQDRIQGEFVEVTMCPEMLCTSQFDIRSGLDLLHVKLSRHLQQMDQNEISDRLKAMGFNPSQSSNNIPNVNLQVKWGQGNAQ